MGGRDGVGRGLAALALAAGALATVAPPTASPAGALPDRDGGRAGAAAATAAAQDTDGADPGTDTTEAGTTGTTGTTDDADGDTTDGTGSSGGAGRGGGREPAPGSRATDASPRVVELRVRVATVDGAVVTVTAPGRRTVTLQADALFDEDDRAMHADGRRLVETEVADAIAEDLADPEGDTITIEAHGDGRGGAGGALELSEERATDVEYHLGYLLGGDYTIESAGYGDTRPVAPVVRPDGTDDPEGRAHNHRVVISYPLD